MLPVLPHGRSTPP
jgi:Mg-chelatase subunit ChlD